jgi:hypothetical protein
MTDLLLGQLNKNKLATARDNAVKSGTGCYSFDQKRRKELFERQVLPMTEWNYRCVFGIMVAKDSYHFDKYY